jgi:hypothetical protein
MPRPRRWETMTRTSKFILRLLCSFAVCIVITIAASDAKSSDKTEYDITFTVER